MATLKRLMTIPLKTPKKKYNDFYEKWKADDHNKNTYVYNHVVLVPISFMKLLKYTKYLRMTQLTNLLYGQLFQTIELLHTI